MRRQAFSQQIDLMAPRDASRGTALRASGRCRRPAGSMIWNTAAWALSTWPWMNGTPGGRERWSECFACCACKSVALEMRQKGSLNAIQVPNGSKRLLGNSNTRFYFWKKYFQRSGSCFSCCLYSLAPHYCNRKNSSKGILAITLGTPVPSGSKIKVLPASG